LGKDSVTAPVLQVKELRTQFFTDDGVVKAVDGVSFDLHPGETLGIVGESGCGKSVTALSILRLIQEPGRITSGEIIFKGSDIVKMREDEVQDIRGKDIAMIFQDPLSSLNPVLKV
jgi:ABC-type dipeptide/oligopeptide/nickel transport system ATPase component